MAAGRLRAGDAWLLFAEGTRSRTASMQCLLPAVARYLDNAPPDAWVVPVGLAGPEQLFALDDLRPRPARVRMSVGLPMRAEALMTRTGGDRRIAMDTIGLAIAQLLPESYRGAYRDAGSLFDAAAALQDVRTAASYVATLLRGGRDRMNDHTRKYNEAQAPGDRVICRLLVLEIDRGPRAVTEAEVTSRFTQQAGWRIVAVRPAEFLSRVATAPATIACVQRLDTRAEPRRSS